MRDFLNSDTHFQEHLDSLLESDLKEWGALNFITSNISIEMQDLIHANLSDNARKIIREWADRAVRPHGDVLKLIFSNDIEGIKTYLKNNTICLVEDPSKMSYMTEFLNVIAQYASLGMLEILQPILAQKATIDEAEIERAADYVLAQAAESNRLSFVELLLEHGADPNYDFRGSSIYAAVKGAHKKSDYRLLKLLAHGGLDVNPDENHYRKVPIDDHSSQEVSVLHFAIYNENVCLVNILLHLGANPLEKNTLKIAQKTGNSEIIDAVECASIRWKDSEECV